MILWCIEELQKSPEKFIRVGVIGRITQGKKTSFLLSDGKRVEKITEVVMGKGAVMQKLSFNHLP